MIYVMSDLHGMYEKYIEMLEKIHFSENDTLYVLGDIIDRGDNSISIIKDMMKKSNIYPLFGNHELMAVQCLNWMFQEVTDDSIKKLDVSKMYVY